jgi:hypothetical protein
VPSTTFASATLIFGIERLSRNRWPEPHAHRANAATGQSLAATQQAFILRQVSFCREQAFNRRHTWIVVDRSWRKADITLMPRL